MRKEQELARITSLYCSTRRLISVQGPGIEGSAACQCSPAGLTYEYQFDYSMNMQRDVPRIYNISWHCKVRCQQITLYMYQEKNIEKYSEGWTLS